MLTKKQNRKRYRLHLYIRNKGYIVNARKREVLIGMDTPIIKQVATHRDEFKYNLQVTINN